MSFPNHPTSNIEDGFSSNFPDYILALPDYSPASPRNTSFESSNNSYGLVLIASPTLSLFHDDTYMKVMHGYDAIIPPKVPILPQLLCLHLECYHQYLRILSSRGNIDTNDNNYHNNTTMVTTNNRIEGRKPSGPMLPPRLRTNGILKIKGTAETKDNYLQTSLHRLTESRDEISLRSGDRNNPKFSLI
uniref:Uncharacterized protein n=1 Tax=Tanacetum cinerariifolium TaxID=118510 RepID=A0A699GVU4_TANCI|nr:hypothetical protein [Tanacetum cinerariifolium]